MGSHCKFMTSIITRIHGRQSNTVKNVTQSNVYTNMLKCDKWLGRAIIIRVYEK